MFQRRAKEAPVLPRVDYYRVPGVAEFLDASAPLRIPTGSADASPRESVARGSAEASPRGRQSPKNSVASSTILSDMAPGDVADDAESR